MNIAKPTSVCLLVFFTLFFSACDKSNGDPEPDPSASAASYQPKTITDWTGEIFSVEYDAQGRITKSLDKVSGHYFAYRYEASRIVRSFYSASSNTETDNTVYVLDNNGSLKEYSFKTTTGNTVRRFNYQYDAEGHVLGFESDSKNAQGTVAYHFRNEFTWKDGNLVRSKQTDVLSNQLANDRTYEYDLARKNTLFPQKMSLRVTFGILDPNFNQNIITGKGNKNLLLKDIATANPSKFGSYSYEFDEQGRTTAIIHFGDKLKIEY